MLVQSLLVALGSHVELRPANVSGTSGHCSDLGERQETGYENATQFWVLYHTGRDYTIGHGSSIE